MKLYYLGLAVLFCACGGSKKEETSPHSLPATDTSARVDTTVNDAGDDGNVVSIASYWENKNGDIPQKYVDHVAKLVSHTKEKQDGDEMDYAWEYLNEKDIQKLNAYEAIYYYLAYPTSFSQNCAGDDFYDSTNTPKIVSYFDDAYAAEARSALQQQALDEKRDSVILLLNKFIAKHPAETDPQYLPILRDLNAVESIPVLVKTASLTNIANFTFLVNIMKEYEPFMQTQIHGMLYGDNAYTYGNRVEANEENMNTIKDLAMQFYKENKK